MLSSMSSIHSRVHSFIHSTFDGHLPVAPGSLKTETTVVSREKQGLSSHQEAPRSVQGWRPTRDTERKSKPRAE